MTGDSEDEKMTEYNDMTEKKSAAQLCMYHSQISIAKAPYHEQ